MAASLIETQVQQTALLGHMVEELKMIQETQKELLTRAQGDMRSQRDLPSVTVAELKHVQQHAGRSLTGSAILRNPEVATLEYVEAAEAAGKVSAKAVQEETWRRRLGSFSEFANWFDSTMQALGRNKTAVDATPNDLVVYHEAQWVKHHGETVLNGGLWPAPSSLEANFSMLSAVFIKHGKSGEYNEQNQVIITDQFRENN